MNTSTRNVLGIFAVTITLALAYSGCATRTYVRRQTGKVDQRVSALETKTNQQMAALSAKHQADISRVDERITTTDAKLAEVSGVAQQAVASAAEANKTGQANQEKIDASEAKIQANATGIAAWSTLAENAWNYQLIEKGDVTFGFNKADLNSAAKAALDVIAQKAAAMPRAEIELQGFTDQIGSKNYNLALSRRRADAVARYLARKDVPLRGIHVIGLGEEKPPASLLAMDPGASPQEARRLARRVYIRVYAPATAIAGEAARQQQPPQ
jgi:OOP family OmpA-OmpF porin